MLAVVAAVVAAAVAAAPAGAATDRPTLRLVDREPLVVRASGFGARERVTVHATTRSGTIVRRLVAGPGGGFTVRFAVAYDACAGIARLRAVGVRSGVVALRARPTIRPCIELGD